MDKTLDTQTKHKLLCVLSLKFMHHHLLFAYLTVLTLGKLEMEEFGNSVTYIDKFCADLCSLDLFSKRDFFVEEGLVNVPQLQICRFVSGQ